MTNDTAGKLGLELVRGMGEITLARIGEAGLANARRNHDLLHHGKSLKLLRRQGIGKTDQALVIAAGPSIKRQNVAEQLLKHRFDGAVIATDSAILLCLSNGIVPDLVVTLDPHPERIARWFGDPELREEHLQQDDYFSRQDMDPRFADQLRVNDEIIRLLDQYGKQMRIALSTSASPKVVKRAIETGMEIFWWNPMYDDPDADNSVTRQLHELNGLPCVNAGGNVGAACWMMAHAVLGKRHVALTGMDFGYYADTPYKNTQYYYEAVALVGEDKLGSIFMPVHNPHLDQWFYTDPAYMWYRNCMLEMAADADCTTYNCTEGGILFGDAIEFVPLSQFLTGRVQTATAASLSAQG
jgi:hypothetical protein